MNDMTDLEARKAYFPDALYLVGQIVALQVLLGADVREHAIAPALPDIEGLPVSRVNESVNVGLELACYVCRKRFNLWPIHWDLTHLASAEPLAVHLLSDPRVSRAFGTAGSPPEGR
jgi:hypothetical protein